MASLSVAIWAASAGAQSDPAGFDTVLDIAYWETSLSEVGSSTQVNLFEQGLLLTPIALGADDGSGRNIELNLQGGFLSGAVTANAGSVVNVVSGNLYTLTARSGSEVNLLGGVMNGEISIEQGADLLLGGGQIRRTVSVAGRVRMEAGTLDPRVNLLPGARFDLAGGQVGRNFHVPEGVLNWSGGTIGDGLQVDDLGMLQIEGGEFYLDGAPLNAGPVHVELIPEGAVLSGTLADGTPFALNSTDGDQLAGFVRLIQQPLPPPPPISLPPPADLAGLRAGQVAVLNSGDQLAANFNAGRGSLLIVNGGVVGYNFELVGGSAILLGGEIGAEADLFYGANLSVTGGAIGIGLQVHNGGVLTLSDGALGADAQVLDGGWAFVQGGDVGSHLTVEAGGELHLSGGSLDDYLSAAPDAGLLAVGQDFKVNGQSVPLSGGRGSVTLGPGESLTGLLSDGTPFALSTDDGDAIAGVIELQHAPAPAITWTERTLSTADGSIRTLRAGQSLTVVAGGVLSESFHAGGGALRIEGGNIYQNFEATDTHIVLVDGGISHGVDLFAGSVLEVQGGFVQTSLQAHAGSRVDLRGGDIGAGFNATAAEVNVSAGGIGSNFTATSGAQVQITGGAVGQSLTIASDASVTLHDGLVNNLISVADGGQFNMQGGKLGSFGRVLEGGRAAISGGVIGEALRAEAGAQVELAGAEFRLNGQPIAGLAAVGDTLAIDVGPSDVLTAVLADGTPVLFSTSDRSNLSRRRDNLDLDLDLPPGVVYSGDHFAPGTLTLRRTEVPAALPGRVEIGAVPPLAVRAGQFVLVEQGQSLPPNFAAAEGSSVIVAGGAVDANFEASGATVLLTSGQIGAYFDAFNGSTVTISGGVVASYFDAVDSTVVITDGTVRNGFNALAGSRVVLTDGYVQGETILYHSRLDASGGYADEVDVYDGSLAEVTDEAVISSLNAERGGEVRIEGGRVNRLTLGDNGQAVVSGGQVQSLSMPGAGEVTFEGALFRLSGVDITPDLDLNTPFVVEDRNVPLEVTWLDGGVNQLWLDDYFHPDAVVQLILAGVLPGDYNHDGLVLRDDYEVWRDTLGMQVAVPGAGADGNLNGVVDAADYSVWRDHLRPGRGGRASVPEPAAAVLALLAPLVAPGRRRGA